MGPLASRGGPRHVSLSGAPHSTINAFWPFLAVDNFLYCIFKNTDQDSICVSIVLKDESEQKHEEHIF